MADLVGQGEVGRAVARRLSSGVGVDAAIAEAIGESEAIVLDSAARDERWGRWTVIGFDPIDHIEVDDVWGADPFETLADELRRNRVRSLWRELRSASRGSRSAQESCSASQGPPCCGGWMGYFGYEAGAFLEQVPVNNPPASPLPLVRLGLYDTVLTYDHVEAQWWVAGIEWFSGAGAGPGTGQGRPGIEDRFETLRRWLNRVGTLSKSAEEPAGRADEFRADMTPSQYEAGVRRAIDYIGAGDVYQVNFAQTFRAHWPGGAGALYRYLRRSNPGWYAGYYGWDDRAVLSSSPELFLQLRDGHVITRPIKGTRPRSADPVVDMSYWAGLLESEKDRAELAMIIDLERNDLGRVCEFGSVRVTAPFALETHPTVYHLAGTVEGTLRPEVGAVDLLRATFPGGSITGAPKIRAMEIIDELEPCQRGVYCGSIGWIGLDGGAALNIAIRTMTYAGGEVAVAVGSGIVADSVCEDEYEETLAKGKGMFQSLGVGDVQPARTSSEVRR